MYILSSACTMNRKTQQRLISLREIINCSACRSCRFWVAEAALESIQIIIIIFCIILRQPKNPKLRAAPCCSCIFPRFSSTSTNRAHLMPLPSLQLLMISFGKFIENKGQLLLTRSAVHTTTKKHKKSRV